MIPSGLETPGLRAKPWNAKLSGIPSGFSSAVTRSIDRTLSKPVVKSFIAPSYAPSVGSVEEARRCWPHMELGSGDQAEECLRVRVHLESALCRSIVREHREQCRGVHISAYAWNCWSLRLPMPNHVQSLRACPIVAWIRMIEPIRHRAWWSDDRGKRGRFTFFG